MTQNMLGRLHDGRKLNVGRTSKGDELTSHGELSALSSFCTLGSYCAVWADGPLCTSHAPASGCSSPAPPSGLCFSGVGGRKPALHPCGLKAAFASLHASKAESVRAWGPYSPFPIRNLEADRWLADSTGKSCLSRACVSLRRPPSLSGRAPAQPRPWAQTG